MTSDLLVEDLRRELARGRVIVVVGPGVSVGATGGASVASWTGLLEDGVARREQLPLGPLIAIPLAAYGLGAGLPLFLGALMRPLGATLSAAAGAVSSAGE